MPDPARRSVLLVKGLRKSFHRGRPPRRRTIEVLKKVEDHFLENEKDSVRAIFTVAGFSFGGSGQHMGIGFVNLILDFLQGQDVARARDVHPFGDAKEQRGKR